MELTERVVKIETAVEQQKDILISMKDDLHLLTKIFTKTEVLEAELKHINQRVDELEESKSAVIKWFLGVAGTAIAGAFAVGLK